MEAILHHLDMTLDTLGVAFLLYLPFLADKYLRKGQQLKRRKK